MLESTLENSFLSPPEINITYVPQNDANHRRPLEKSVSPDHRMQQADGLWQFASERAEWIQMCFPKIPLTQECAYPATED